MRNARNVCSDFNAFGHANISSETVQSEPLDAVFQSSYNSQRSKFSLILILLKVESSIQVVEDLIQPLDDVIYELKQRPIKNIFNVIIPKIPSQSSMKIDTFLSMLGIKSLFHPDKTELTYISSYERLSMFHDASFDFSSTSFDDHENEGFDLIHPSFKVLKIRKTVSSQTAHCHDS